MANGYRVEKWNRPYPPNPAMLRLEMEAEGFRVMNWCDMPDVIYGMHKHETDQSHWIISGSIEIAVANIPYVLSAGDRDHLPANTYHTARVIGDEPVQYLMGEKTVTQTGESRADESERLVDNMILMQKMIDASRAEEESSESDEDISEATVSDDEKSRGE